MSFSRRDLLKGLAVTGAVAATPACSSLASKIAPPTSAQQTKKPNLLIIFPDEMRTHTLGFMNQDPSLTPNLNKFATQSAVLPQAVSNFPLCTPFRGMLMTGQYPYRNGIQGNSHTAMPGKFGGKDFGIELKKQTQTWSDIMKAQGYSMGYIGKWHLDAPEAPFVPSYNNPMEGRYWNDWTAPDRRHGFDFWYSYGTYDKHLTPMYWTNETPRDKPLVINQWSPEHEADIAINYLRNENGQYRDNDKPFTLVVSMNPPHSPYDQVPQKYLDRFSGETSESLNTRPNVQWDKEYLDGYGPKYFKEYMAMVNGVDEQFGRIIDELDRLNLTEDTLVIFFSDHGCCLGSNGKPTKNVHYEEAMRIPMMFRWPGKIKPGQDDILFSAPDIYPTMFGLMGMDEYIPDTVEGTNYANTVLGKDGDKRPTSQLYTFIPYGAQSYGRRGIRTDRYTLMIDRKIGKPLTYVLHDNQQDPYQMSNIAESNTALVEKLIEEELMPWLEYTGDPWRPAEVPASVLNAYT
ncbi:sulfatase-like hydrolase/transferase [uncultured Photobacterium sp.]|uniref:sulfatase-like hydrolase/transferase n=1 Tax=uncultured Photobacterium sp. TaxID=173973 RepID=UPI0026300A87|nr:sulfatase-like hydrolase/transferase [uncultured Photobacterium sp.]